MNLFANRAAERPNNQHIKCRNCLIKILPSLSSVKHSLLAGLVSKISAESWTEKSNWFHQIEQPGLHWSLYKYPWKVKAGAGQTDDPVSPPRSHLSVTESTADTDWLTVAEMEMKPFVVILPRASQGKDCVVWFSDNYWAEGVWIVWGWHARLSSSKEWE